MKSKLLIVLPVAAVVALTAALLMMKISGGAKSSHEENLSGREPMNEEVTFIDQGDDVGDPPSMYVDDKQMAPAFVDWNDHAEATDGVRDVDRQVINEVSLAGADEAVTFSLTSGAPLLAAELSYYPPGSSSADFGAEPEARIDCHTDGRCSLSAHGDSTDISVRIGDGIERGGFLGLYLEYSAADRSDGVLFRSIAWAFHLGQ